MTLNEIIKLASSRYDTEGRLEQCWDFDNSCSTDTGCGDTLALFIAREIEATYDPGSESQEQLQAVSENIALAADQLEGLAHDLLWENVE